MTWVRRTYTHRPAWLVAAIVSISASLLLATSGGASARTVAGARHGAGGSATAARTFRSQVFASGNGISHATPTGSEAISQPDDITQLAGKVYVGFQNGVGPQGQASTTGNTNSTIVEFTLSGREVRQWDVAGKCDGVTADPASGQVIATVDEDANSSIYLVDPTGAAVHYTYSEPLPSDGGTDAISIYRGLVLISASAPGTTGKAAPQPQYPAVYRATFDTASHTVRMAPLFLDESLATVANTDTAQHGHHVHLALTDPDSNEVVPSFAPRFAGDFMLTSQGDEEQIFVSRAGARHQSLSVLRLTASVDDSAWPSATGGALFTTDNSDNNVYKVTGPFRRGSVLVATTPCDENSAPSTCPGPGFPPNYLGSLNPNTGQISSIHYKGPTFEPQGVLFLP
jgi:hypothetical protein